VFGLRKRKDSTTLSFCVKARHIRSGRSVFAFSGIVLISSGALLTLSIPTSLRVRFKRARLKEKTNYVYGFGSTLAIGIGATLGSPLFVLIPENIVQYEFVSLGALVLATALSVFMAKVYSDMYITSKQENLGALGGPSFTKVACGTRSMRYFVSRVSMWIANTALAAYSKLVLIIFEVEFFSTDTKILWRKWHFGAKRGLWSCNFADSMGRRECALRKEATQSNWAPTNSFHSRSYFDPCL
jgi:hypothetical protein